MKQKIVEYFKLCNVRILDNEHPITTFSEESVAAILTNKQIDLYLVPSEISGNILYKIKEFIIGGDDSNNDSNNNISSNGDIDTGATIEESKKVLVF